MPGGYVRAVIAVAAATVLSWLMFPFFDAANLIMMYLAAIVAIAARDGRGPSVVASLLSVAAFDFFFIPPYLTFAAADLQYVPTFAVMLGVGLLIGGLTVRIRRQAEAARERERQTAALYAMSRELLIEDEPQIRRFLRATVAGAGYRLFEAATAESGIIEVDSRQPDVVIVDLGLPDMDGLAVIRRVRGWSDVPIIVLSARGQERDKVTALDAGADDYVSKPFAAGELLARIRVALRHAAGASHEDDAPFGVGELGVDHLRRQVFLGGGEVRLTPIEYKLLTTLVRYAGKVITHQQLLREVWGPGHAEQAHYVRVYMGHLRHKLEVEAARPRYLLTEPGVGYRLAAE